MMKLAFLRDLHLIFVRIYTLIEILYILNYIYKMKFLITMTANSVSQENKEKYEKLGFEFEEMKEESQYFGEVLKYHKKYKPVYLEVKKLEDLIELLNIYGEFIMRNSWDGKEK